LTFWEKDSMFSRIARDSFATMEQVAKVLDMIYSLTADVKKPALGGLCPK
jgi:hypothetical protein